MKNRAGPRRLRDGAEESVKKRVKSRGERTRSQRRESAQEEKEREVESSGGARGRNERTERATKVKREKEKQHTTRHLPLPKAGHGERNMTTAREMR